MKPFLLSLILSLCWRLAAADVISITSRTDSGCKFDETRAKVNHDACDQRGGNIMGIVIAYGQGTPPYQFKWLDENGAVVGTAPDVFNLTAGKYQLHVTDQLGCTAVSKEYVVQNIKLELPVPQYNNQYIQRNSSTRLVLNNFTAGGWYQLYDAPVNGNLISVNMTGQFVVGPLDKDKTYYIQYVAGSCSSGFTAVNIKVFDNTQLIVPNAFSPNGDGINDKWLIKSEGLIDKINVQVFNRYGQLVYTGSGMNVGWDGRHKGDELPSATYYWILQAHDQAGKAIRMNGAVTLIR